MSYDIHIVRTKDWLEASSAPITKEDVDALIASDPELEWSTTDYVDMGEAGAATRYYMIKWRGEPCFWWYEDQVQCSNPDEAQQVKLAQMARAVNGYAVGDNGEVYGDDGRVDYPAAPVAPAPSPPGKPAFLLWPLWKQLLVAFLLGCVLLALKLLLFER
jgi:hypothetical protein